MQQTHVTINTQDGLALAATVYAPQGSAKAGIVINSATAVKQSYYKHFAAFLAEQGYQVVTYDYRGIGQSALRNTRDKRLTMQAWGEQDLAAIIEWAEQQHGDLAWHCIGHSVGGQIVGLVANNGFFKSVYCISAQSGHWRHWQALNKLKMFAMWYVVVPTLAGLLGKVPGVFLGGENLPQGVARQWAFWGRNRDYIVDRRGVPIREGFERLRCDMRFLLIDDDLDFAPPAAVRALYGLYKNANASIEVVRAKSHGGRPIGHFGFFLKQHEYGLWLSVINWLQELR